MYINLRTYSILTLKRVVQEGEKEEEVNNLIS